MTLNMLAHGLVQIIFRESEIYKRSNSQDLKTLADNCYRENWFLIYATDLARRIPPQENTNEIRGLNFSD